MFSAMHAKGDWLKTCMLIKMNNQAMQQTLLFQNKLKLFINKSEFKSGILKIANNFLNFL